MALSPDDFINSGTQNFATAANWSTGAVPNNNNDAYIGLAAPTTVVSNVSETVDSIATGVGDVLKIAGGGPNNNSFFLYNGTGPNENQGTIDVENAILRIDGSPGTPFVNMGILAANNGGTYIWRELLLPEQARSISASTVSLNLRAPFQTI